MKVEYRRKTDFIPKELHTFKPEQRRKAFWVGLAIIASVAVGAALWVAWGVQERERQYVGNLQKRMDLLEMCFDTRSWTAIESMHSTVLKSGLDVLRERLEPQPEQKEAA